MVRECHPRDPGCRRREKNRFYPQHPYKQNLFEEDLMLGFSDGDNDDCVIDLDKLISTKRGGKYFDPIVFNCSIVVMGQIDLGAEINLISLKLASYLSSEKIPNDIINMKSMHGGTIQGYAVKERVNYRGLEIDARFYIVEGLRVKIGTHLLIGNELIHNVIEEKGMFSVFSEKIKKSMNIKNIPRCAKLIPITEDVVQDYILYNGDLYRVAKENEISPNRVYKTIISANEFLTNPYSFMYKKNKNWLNDVLKRYNDMLEDLVFDKRLDPWQHHELKSLTKVLEKAREPTAAPEDLIFEYFKHFKNFEEVARFFDISIEEVIAEIKQYKRIYDNNDFADFIIGMLNEAEKQKFFEIYRENKIYFLQNPYELVRLVGAKSKREFFKLSERISRKDNDQRKSIKKIDNSVFYEISLLKKLTIHNSNLPNCLSDNIISQFDIGKNQDRNSNIY